LVSKEQKGRINMKKEGSCFLLKKEKYIYKKRIVGNGEFMNDGIMN